MGKDYAITHIYSQNVQLLYRYGRKFTKNDEFIKDTIQDLFFDLIRRSGNLGETDNIRFYLIAAFRRRLLKSLNKTSSIEYIEGEIYPSDNNYVIVSLMKYKKTLLVIPLLLMPGLYTLASGGDNIINNSGEYALWAFILGGISAISLPLGSLLGISWEPKPAITASLTAFGAGALLAALSVELIAPTVMEFVGQVPGDYVDHGWKPFAFLFGGCVIGGIFFVILNELLNSSGGYLRKMSTVITQINHNNRLRYSRILKKMGNVRIFRFISSEHIQTLIKHISHISFKSGDILFHRGEISDRLYIIEKGKIELQFENGSIKIMKENDMTGQVSLLYNEPNLATARAIEPVKAFMLLSEDFVKIKEQCPDIEKALQKYALKELLADIKDREHKEEEHEEAENWSDEAIANLHHTNHVPTEDEVKEAVMQHSSAPLSIWLGIFLDGIPESFVIGAGFLTILSLQLSHSDVSFTDVVPYTLIAGLFLSNFPEAFSSSIGMKKMGWRSWKVLSLWVSLMLMTAVGAAFGYYYGAVIPHHIAIGVEGLAAGAMLTMIAQTMIPEAVHIGGPKVVGLSTLAGYLAAVGFKVFE